MIRILLIDLVSMLEVHELCTVHARPAMPNARSSVAVVSVREYLFSFMCQLRRPLECMYTVCVTFKARAVV